MSWDAITCAPPAGAAASGGRAGERSAGAKALRCGDSAAASASAGDMGGGVEFRDVLEAGLLLL
jgi:hypothetical protein